jgi:hypothetical protein
VGVDNVGKHAKGKVGIVEVEVMKPVADASCQQIAVGCRVCYMAVVEAAASIEVAYIGVQECKSNPLFGLQRICH